ENDPRATLNSGLAHTTTRAPSPGAGSAASSTARAPITRTDTAATGSRTVRNAVLPRLVSSAIWPSTQIRPSLPTQSPTRRSAVRTGTGESAEVCSGMATPQWHCDRPAGALSGADLRQAPFEHGDHRLPARVGLLVGQHLLDRRRFEHPQPRTQGGNGEVVVAGQWWRLGGRLRFCRPRRWHGLRGPRGLRLR